MLSDNKKDTQPCVICAKELDSAFGVGDWDTTQPYHGGEIQLIFGYGSEKFDLNMNGTIFSGVVCDECCESLVGKMKRLK